VIDVKKYSVFKFKCRYLARETSAINFALHILNASDLTSFLWHFNHCPILKVVSHTKARYTT
jgi:hypothetical protein